MLLMLLASLHGQAQVSGMVTDNRGEPLIGRAVKF